MNAGAYREPITIEKANGFTTDDVGNRVTDWQEHFRGYAYMNNLSGTECWEAAQTQAENTVMFILRYHPKLSVVKARDFRLLHRGNIYDISSVDNVQYKNETVKIRATAKE